MFPSMNNDNFTNASFVQYNRSYRWSFLTKWFYYMFLLTAPLNVYGIGTGNINYRFSRILLLLSVISIVSERLIKKEAIFPKFRTFEYLIFVYCFLALLSISYVFNFGAFAVRFFGLIECVMIFYVIKIFTYEEGCWLKSIKIYLLSSIAVLFASIYQVVNVLKGNFFGSVLPFYSLQLLDRYETLEEWGHFGGVIEGATRVSSTFGEPNMLAGYCASLIPYAIVVGLISIRDKIIQWRSMLYLFLLLGLTVMIVGSASKTGLLSMVVGIIFTILFTMKKFSSKQRIWVYMIMAIIIVCSALYGLISIDLILSRLELGDSGHMEYRLVALNDFLTGSWFIGEGFGQYNNISAHTIVLTALLELGLLGGIIVLMITLQPLWYSKYIFELSSIIKNNLQVKSYLFFLSAGLASYVSIIIGLYLYDYWIHPFTWISISLFLSIVSRIETGLKRGVWVAM